MEDWDNKEAELESLEEDFDESNSHHLDQKMALQDSIERIQAELENFEVHKLFLDIQSENLGP